MALAQESHLSIFRLLVQAGKEGMPAGDLGEQLGIPAATLSFHLKELSHAKLVNQSLSPGETLTHPVMLGVMLGLLPSSMRAGAGCEVTAFWATKVACYCP